LAHGLAEKHGAHVASAAGVIAGLSPQNDWDMNVHQAHVVMDTMTNHQHTAWSDEMTKHANKIWGKAKDPKIRNMIGDIQGKTLDQIEKEGGKDRHLRQAVWIRAHHEAHGDKRYREVKPDGSFGDFRRFTEGKKKGQEKVATWKATSGIVNAVKAMHAHGDAEKILLQWAEDTR
jgi:hypothetical protein